MALAENPWSSRAWAQKVNDSVIAEGLLELMRDDGCEYQKQQDDGILREKATEFMVPQASVLRLTMDQIRTEDPPHGALLGEKWMDITGIWIREEAMAMVMGATTHGHSAASLGAF